MQKSMSYVFYKGTCYDIDTNIYRLERSLLRDKIIANLQKAQPLFIGEEDAFRSAVMIPLVEKDGELHVLFQVRSYTMRKQPGDISFPGGKIDATDDSPLAAAIRETHEELGIAHSDIHVIAELSPYIASPSFIVYPFVGILSVDDFHINEAEVAELFFVPLRHLLSYEPYVHLVDVAPQPGEDFPFEKIMNGAQYQWRSRKMEEWFYDYDRYTIWGLTARILKYFLQLVR